MPYYKTFQIHCAIEKPFWEKNGLPPSMWTDSPFDRLNLLYDDNGAPACYLAYVNGLEAGALDRLTPEAADAFVRSEIAKPLRRIHFAGEHTALTNRGMEGAMESGERAALEVLGGI